MGHSLRPDLRLGKSLRTITVRRAYDVSPGLRRVEFALDDSAEAMTSYGFDDEVKLYFPDPHTGDLVLPGDRDRTAGKRKPIARTFTVREWSKNNILSIEFARHAGVASEWAQSAAPGARLGMSGPHRSKLHPVDTDWLLIAGEETAFPAIARWLEEMPADMRGVVLLEVPDASHEFELSGPAALEIRWVPRGAVSAAESSALLDAVRAVSIPDGSRPFCWVAGEKHALREIRRYLRTERLVPAERTDFSGHWRLRHASHEG